MKRSIYLILSCITVQYLSFGSLFAMTKIIEDSEFGTITISKKDMVIIATAQKMHNQRTAFFTSVEKKVGTSDCSTHSYQFNPNAPETTSPVMIRSKLVKLLKSHIANFEKEEEENRAPVQTLLRRTQSYVDQSTLVVDQEVHMEFCDTCVPHCRSTSPALIGASEGRLILSQSN